MVCATKPCFRASSQGSAVVSELLVKPCQRVHDQQCASRRGRRFTSLVAHAYGRGRPGQRDEHCTNVGMTHVSRAAMHHAGLGLPPPLAHRAGHLQLAQHVVKGRPLVRVLGPAGRHQLRVGRRRALRQRRPEARQHLEKHLHGRARAVRTRHAAAAAAESAPAVSFLHACRSRVLTTHVQAAPAMRAVHGGQRRTDSYVTVLGLCRYALM